LDGIYILSKDDKELIDIYGERILMKRWYYEDDFDVRKKLEKKGAAALKVNKGRV